ncbi:S1 RNA-binding domain-containing protein [Streptomyces sp. NPDC053560]|uniref:S1 RNA-binding domain-containing protein n=1 Tax=Streptomyces sp. NPDC053560 TaxID=3365711 RepID=UPI0037D7CBE1
MDKIKIERTDRPDDNIVFFAMPYGRKSAAGGPERDYDDLYDNAYAAAVRDLDLTPCRADSIFGTSQGVLESAWRGIQQAGVVVIDFSTRSADVALEFGWAMCLHKRMIVLAQDIERDVPTDVTGLLRPIQYSFDGTGIPRMMQDLKAHIRQALAEPVGTEMTLKPLEGHAEQDRAEVLIADRDHVIVKGARTGRIAEMHKQDVDYLRDVPVDMSKRYPVGREVSGTFVTEADGRPRFSQRVNQRNPWPDLQNSYPKGHVFVGRVVDIKPAGAYIAVAHGVNGLLPGAQTRAADLQLGMEVEAVVTGVDADRQRIHLALSRQPAPPAGRPAADTYPRYGDRQVGTVTRVVPEQSGGGGGYVLMTLQDWPNLPLAAFLHCSRMTPELRTRMNSRLLAEGDTLPVEVIQVHPSRKNPPFHEVKVRDLAELPDVVADDPAADDGDLDGVPAAT